MDKWLFSPCFGSIVVLLSFSIIFRTLIGASNIIYSPKTSFVKQSLLKTPNPETTLLNKEKHGIGKCY